GPGDHAGHPAVVGLTAHLDLVVAGQHHHAAGLGRDLPADAELLGQVGPDQLDVAERGDVAVDVQRAVDPDLAREEPGEPTGVVLAADTGVAGGRDAEHAARAFPDDPRCGRAGARHA